MDREQSYIRVSELELRREQAIEKCGETLVLKAESCLQSLLKEAEIFIRLDADNLERVLRDGRFKSIFEIKVESTIVDTEELMDVRIIERRLAEEKLFGYSQDLPPALRPIYGYVASSVNAMECGDVIPYYGEIGIKLKQPLKNRTTFTGDDSLFRPQSYRESFEKMTRQPSMFEAANIASFVSWEDIAGNAENLRWRLETIASSTSLADLMEAKEQHFYFEAQIHAGVTIEDIDEIIYIEDIPSDSIAQLALERGIAISVVNLNES
ncbi:hypothetical protein ACE1CD_26930 [Aerosakkonema sp. BLCC-F183]|uniref:hypothetical protein n=1 Tax=Aerosakkonema sp. BLCC-F183 TaxID=3342834 RepID=UPI0035BA6926